MTGKSELLTVLDQIEKDNNIKKEDIIHIVENALISAYKKHVGKNVIVEASVNYETGEMNVNTIKTVVADVINPSLEINIQDLNNLHIQANIGDKIQIPLNVQDFSRIAAQTAKQVITQKIKESERNAIFDEISNKLGQIISGIIYRVSNQNIIVDLDKTEAILPIYEQVPTEKFYIGQRIRSVIIKVDKHNKHSGILLSRTSTQFVRKLFELEVPEIYDKIVEIINIVREPGIRTKISLISHNDKVDPIGACVGINGIRIKPIIEELKGERIDLIHYSNDFKIYVANALAPAKVISITMVSEEHKKLDAIVDDSMLSLAIGKNGHNVRLATKLTGWYINVKSNNQQNINMIKPLKDLEISQNTIKILQTYGVTDIASLIKLSLNDLLNFTGIGNKTANKILLAIKKYNKEA
ncbi:MAG: transcription termination factor NusA [Endomicrobium sp.]|jgi:N utilization substance protein A|nr:transcription termination factor NusA [Endomicrobium sp.]